MAIKQYSNKTNMMQVVYDRGGNKYEVVPNGTVNGEESDFAKYGCLQEEKRDKAPAKK